MTVLHKILCQQQYFAVYQLELILDNTMLENKVPYKG